ncbi:uncharacterized protein LOC143448463 [Clavelina lepadiformis]|uniref:uncharacterized protein LOC143448463 n=1 Tax=Clavelina lepadiformis TaxID=159417 RepID=UPI0040430B4C
MSFNANEEIHFKNDPNLMQIFKKTENEFCKHSSSPTDFSGGKPCKSPYATYTVVVPKGNHTCSLDPNNWIDGSNCRRLNLTRFDTILVFARVQSWSNYRSRDDFIGITTNLELTNRNCGHPCSTVSLDILWFVTMSLWVSFMFLNDDV